MDRPCRVRFSHEAARDMEDAVNWIKEDSVEAAEAFFLRLRSRCENDLSSTPHMGVTFTLADETKLFALTCGTYRVFYTIDDNTRTVTLIRILHASRDIRHIMNTET